MAPPTRKDLVRDFLGKREALIGNEQRWDFGVHTTRRYTALVDEFIRSLLCCADLVGPGRGPCGAFAVAATGSYGRRELCFGSDIDLLIVHNDGLPEETRKRIVKAFYPMWDAHLDLAYSFMTAEECLQLVRLELSVLTAVMELRYIVGSNGLFRAFEKDLNRGMQKDKKGTLDRLLQYNEARTKKYGKVDYFLEPDIKEGLGGLRDLHFMCWITRHFLGVPKLGHLKQMPDFSHFALSQLIYSKHFLLKIRNNVHLLRGRREDRLTVANQRDIARLLGYNDRPYSTGPERFMRNLYLHLNRVRYGREEFLNKALDLILPLSPVPKSGRLKNGFHIHKGHIILAREGLMDDDPLLVLKGFKEANQRGLFLGSGFIWEARRKLLYKGRELAESPEGKRLFLDLVLHPRNPKVIRLALEVGLIGLFIPEFKRIRNLAQFGYYHVETIDLHALTTLQVLNELSSGHYDDQWQGFSKVFKKAGDRESLYLAALIHDIGKAYRGEHSRKGTRIVPRILGRLGITGEKKIRNVSFLVDNHHLLVNTSQRRDLNDEKTAVQVAQAIQSEELLNLLFLLTVADCYSTGPFASSEWKIMLLVELFTKVKHILGRGRLATPDATTTVEKRKGKLYKKMVHDFPKKDVLHLMEQASTWYYLNTPQEDMERHFRLALRMGDKKLNWHLTKLKTAPVTKVNLCTRDRPGLFSRMVGVFTCNNIKVLHAVISTLKNGMVFDNYWVTNPLDPLREKEIWAETKEDALRAIEGGEEFDALIEKRLLHKLETASRASHPHQRVRIDNEVSDFFTCIEVTAQRRKGLLYLLAKEMFALDLNIRFASINSERERTTGIFHVRDNRGQKVYDKDCLQDISKALAHVIR